MRGLRVHDLGPGDGAALAAFLEQQPAEYRRDFLPFRDEGAEALEEILAAKRRDLFRAVLFDELWVAYYQLRGWDQGYERPAFGVLVSHDHGGRGLGGYCLTAALTECRLLGVASCMLKVAPTNERAAQLYLRHGFRFESTCPVTGHAILSIQF